MPRKSQRTSVNSDAQKSSTWGNYWYTLTGDGRARLIVGIVLLTLTLLTTIAYFSFFFTGKADYSIVELSRAERVANSLSIHNWLGLPGACVARAMIDGAFGVFSVLFLIMGALYGLQLLKVLDIKCWKLFFCSSFLLIWGSVTLGFIQLFCARNLFFRLGGAHGEWLATLGNNYMQALGMSVILLVTLVIFLIIADKHFIDKVQFCYRSLACKLWKKDAAVPIAENNNDDEVVVETSIDQKEIDIKIVEQPDTIIVEQPVEEPVLTIDKPVDQTPDTHADTSVSDAPLDIEKTEEVEISDENNADRWEKMGPYDPRKDLENYKFPPLSLLKVYDNETAPVIDQAEQQANASRIVQTLRNYDVEIESIKATVGPTVTLYEVVPKAGTRISKIQSLENDIMLSLSAIGIRIIAPMPGKGTVGIEVPNEKPQVVSMHSVIASKRFQDEVKMKLPVAIGRTITNEVFTFDLAKTPHLLVAGATGQGKSVGLNAIIASLIYKKHPAELKFVLVDPKMVEFSIYKPLIRHYMAAMPDQEDRDIIITDCQKVINTLNSLVIEMEDRYSLLADANCRNLEDYNDKFNSRHLNPVKDVENVVTHKILHHKFMPYLVIVIDEYGDFIMQAGKEVERPIQRIAQKARAVGMHMILATQRPDVKIVTGTIKANIPTRIAFRTQSVVDSRTVLDAKGADQLIGKGDMLYSGGGNLTRIQCAFIDTPEVEALVNHVSEQQHFLAPYQLPEYVPEGQEEAVAPGSVDMNRLDPMFADVARYVVSKQEGSTSRLQRAFEIGYNRAGKLSDQLEAAGIVGPNKGPKGRDVLIQDMDSLAQLLQSLGC
ncbi:MAG: DNA translocase FtsK [Paludibacteraceae bacterium]|nr:DNA translocase FtsK [Paludibacteraceae bacterium]